MDSSISSLSRSALTVSACVFVPEIIDLVACNHLGGGEGGDGGCACTHTGQDESAEQCAHKPKQEGTECGSEGLPLFTACVSCTARLIRGKTCKQYVLHVYAS